MIIAATRYGEAGGSSGGKLPAYTTTGMAPHVHKAETGDNWELVFLGRGTITFTEEDVDVDVFAVGGGGSGTAGEGWTQNWAYAYGGNGGNGGEIVNATGITLTKGTAYSIEIGGSGQPTTAFGYTAEGANGARGGDGARNGTKYQSGDEPRNSTAGGPGQYAFGDANTQYRPGAKYGAGGGGGGADSKPGSAGGDTDGGAGGVGNPAANGNAGLDCTGSGGGGGGAQSDWGDSHGYGKAGTGGLGGSGIVIIRNARTST